MSYRDELQEAQARAEALRQRVEALEADNARLRADVGASNAPAAPPQPAAPPSPRSRILGAVIGIGVMLLIAGVVVLLVLAVRPDATGTVTAKGPAVGDWTMTVDDCTSGQRAGFFGVDLASTTDDGLEVRFIQDAVNGLVVNVNSTTQKGRALQLRAADCKQLQGSVTPGNTTVNDITVVGGKLDFDCATAGGDHVTGHVVFDGCH